MKKKENRSLGSNLELEPGPFVSHPLSLATKQPHKPVKIPNKFSTYTCKLSFLTVTSITGDPNLVPRVLSYPPYGALSRSVGRVGENPGNEVEVTLALSKIFNVNSTWASTSFFLSLFKNVSFALL